MILNLDSSHSVDINRILLNSQNNQRIFNKTSQNERQPNVTTINNSDKPIEIRNKNVKEKMIQQSDNQKRIHRYSSTIVTNVKKEINNQQQTSQVPRLSSIQNCLVNVTPSTDQQTLNINQRLRRSSLDHSLNTSLSSNLNKNINN